MKVEFCVIFAEVQENVFNTLAPKPPLAPNAPKIGAFSKILFSLENGWKPIARLYT